jgi:hypothetical protein
MRGARWVALTRNSTSQNQCDEVLGAAANMSQVNAFLRFVRWRTDQNVTGSPVVIVDIVAKAG